MTDFSTLKKLFPIVQSVSPTKPLKEIYASVLLVNDGRELKATATDGEINIEATVSCDERAWAATVPSKQLGQVVTAANDDSEITQKGSDLKFEGEFGELTLKSGKADLFPNAEVAKPTSFIEMESGDLARCINGALVSCERMAGSRYILDTVKLMTSEANVECHGTDGKRLSIFRGPAIAVGPTDKDRESCIPRRHAIVISKMLKANLGERVRVAVRENDICVWTKQIAITARQMNGSFPDLYTVIDMTHDGLRVEVQLHPLIRAIENALIVSDEYGKVDLSFSGTKLMVTSSSELGNTSIKVNVPKSQIKTSSRFNASLLLSALKDLASAHPEATISQKGDGQLLTVNRGRNALHGVMPLTFHSERE